MNLSRRMALYEQAQQVLSADAGGVFVYYQTSLLLIKPWVKNATAGAWPDYPDFQKRNRVEEIYIGRE